MRHALLIFLILQTQSCFCQNADYRLLKSINQSRMPVWDESMRIASFSVYPMLVLTPCGIFLNGYHKNDRKQMRNGLKSAASLGIAISISTALKYAVSRPRPYNTYPGDIIKRDNAGPYSFPSGHTTAAFGVATSLSLTYKKWYVATPAYLYAGLVAYSRMRLGMHYPTDVLTGALLSTGSGFLTWKLDEIIRKRDAKKKEEASKVKAAQDQ